MMFLLLSLSAAAAPAEFFADIEAFRAKSLGVQTALEQREASSRRRLSKSLFWAPDLQLGVGKEVTRLDDNPETGNTYWRASTSWNLFRGGSDLYGYQAALRAESAQGYGVQEEALKTELLAAQLIFRQLFLQDSLSSQKRLLALKEEAYRIGKGRYGQGKIPLQELVKMEVDLAQQRNRLRETELSLAENELAYRSGFVERLTTRAWPFGPTQKAELGGGEGSFTRLKLLSSAAAAERQWKAARALFWPAVDFSLSYTQYPLDKLDHDLWSGTLSLSLPLFSRFDTAASSAEAYAQFVSLRNQAEKSEREEGLKREYLEKKIFLSRESLKESEANRDKADRLYKDMLRSFQLGRLSTNDLFQEQNRRIEAEMSYSGSLRDFHEALAEACALWGVNLKDCLR